MNVKLNVQAKSIKGKNFTINFDLNPNGRISLADSPKAVLRWNWGSSCWYKKNLTIRELLFILKFLRENKIKLIHLSSYDLAEVITQLLELENRKTSSKNPSKRNLSSKHSQKALLYTHAIMDLAVILKEI